MSLPHRPAPGRPAPVSTYRLQLHAGFGFAAAAEIVPYLARLGVTHAYLSPILAAGEGSMHGYDVVDHSRVSPELGGREGLDQLVRALHDHGLGAVVDVVPNHMAVPTPAWHNAALWSVLRDGPSSPYAGWFDVDWQMDHGALLMPVLGSRIGQVLAAGELTLDPAGGASGDEPVLRYYDHEFPVRPGTESLPMATLVDQQWYRLAHWRVADQELNYRRFFDVDTLAALRQEDEDVFAQTHEILIGLVLDGSVDGLRIDHPDGLADPAPVPRPAGRPHARLLGRRREDPRARRGPPGRLEGLRHNGLRHAAPGQRGLPRRGRARRSCRPWPRSWPVRPRTGRPARSGPSGR